jgi:CHAT domain-containing protein
VLAADPAALAWARQALSDGLRELPSPLPFAAEALAWAIKEACNHAWASAPVQVPVGVQLLRQMCEREPAPVFVALHGWMQGLALIREGALDDALRRLAEAEAIFEQLERPLSAAQTLVPRMVALGMLGRLDEALELGRDAVQRFLALGDDVSAGKVEVNLGSLLGRADRYPEAIPLLRRAAVRFARAQQVGPSVAADITLANALIWLHQFDEALRVSLRALMRAKAHGLNGYSASASGAIGRLELMRGRYQKALAALVEASRLHVQAGSAPQLQIDAELFLASGYLLVNLLPEAEQIFTRVIELAQRYQAPVEEALAWLQRAKVRAEAGDCASALSDLEQARRLFNQRRNAVAAAQADLVQVRLLLSARRGQEALALAQRTEQSLRESALVPLRLEAQAYLAGAQAAVGRLDEARRGFQATLALATSLAPVRVQCHLGLAELALAQDDRAEAHAQLRAVQALVNREQAELLSDEARTAVGRQAERAQELMLGSLLSSGAAGPTVAACVEEGRGRVSLASANPAGAAALNVEHRLAHLRWVQQNYRQSLAAGDAAAAARLADERMALEQSLLDERRREQLVQQARPSTEALDSGAALVERSLQALPADMAIVSWHESHASGTAELLACVLRSGRVEHRRVSAPEWPAKLKALRFQLESLRFGAPPAAAVAAEPLRRVLAHLQSLHTLLWKPIEALLAGAERVVLVPHRRLHYVPFAALHDGAEHLVSRHEFTQIPSLRLWLTLHDANRATRPGAPRQALIVGHGGQHLPHVSHEVQAVAAAPSNTRAPLPKSAATRGALQHGLSDQAVDVLHLACHGQFRADSPSFSNLELADGPLTLLDAHELPLKQALVTLSACDTGQSAQAPGNEWLGLVRGFLGAGAHMVLSTLWTVDDESTAGLMKDFYRRLLGGGGPAAALRGAQRQLARDRQHPFYWAPFTISGLG